jgi:hypothetical protein
MRGPCIQRDTYPTDIVADTGELVEWQGHDVVRAHVPTISALSALAETP